MTDTELEQLNHAIAAIDGYTNIKQLDTSRNQETQPKKKLFVGTNTFTESKSFIPDYVGDLNAIVLVFERLDLSFQLQMMKCRKLVEKTRFFRWYAFHADDWVEEVAETPAIALCKLLVSIHGAKVP